jgi:predicted CXXCH cytochrome family protein
VGGAAALTVILLSCSSFETNRTVLAPPSIPGAEFVGSESCETCHESITRNFRTATHARLKAKGENAKNIGCESCHGPGSLHVSSGGAARTIVNPRRSPETCFQCHLEVRAKFELPHRHPVLEGKMSCADCHNPHVGMAIKGGGTNLPQMLKGGGMAFLGENETCFQCHTSQRGPFVFEHEAVREGCVSCHSPHGSVNQRMLNERNATLCLKCHFQEQKTDGRIFIGDSDHTNRLPQGTCWSAGCHEAIHGSQVNGHFRF